MTQPTQTVTIRYFKGCHQIKNKCQGKLTVVVLLHGNANSNAVHSEGPIEHHAMGAAGTSCMQP